MAGIAFGCCERSIQHSPADRVVNYVEAFASSAILYIGFNGLVTVDTHRTNLFNECTSAWRNSCKYLGAKCESDLDGRKSHSAGTRVNQHSLTGMHLRPIHKALPCGDCHQGSAAASNMLNVFGFGAKSAASADMYSASVPW